MTHANVFRKFEILFPNLSGDNMELWFQHGRNTIRVRTKDKREYVFAYYGDNDWALSPMNRNTTKIGGK